MIEITGTVNTGELLKDLAAKSNAGIGIIRRFRDEALELVNEVARGGILGGIGNPSLKIKTGGLWDEGLRYRQFVKKRSTAGNAYWHPILNIVENWKSRPGLKLLRRLKKEVEGLAEVDNLYNQALERWAAVRGAR